jgi:hypothetical protein
VVMKGDLFDKLFEYISVYYPDLHYSNDMISYLRDMFGGNQSIRVINYILDHNREQVVHVEGAHHLKYLKDEWNFALHRRIVPAGYCQVNYYLAMNSYKLFFKHKLAKRGAISQKIVILQNAEGGYDLATHVVIVLLADELSRPILTAGTFILNDVWVPKVDVPVVIRPTIRQQNGERFYELEQELFQTTYNYEFMTRALNINEAWMPVLIGHMHRLGNAEIAIILNIPKTTVNYYCTKLIEKFNELFLTEFDKAESCALFLIRMGIRPEWLHLKPDGTTVWK